MELAIPARLTVRSAILFALAAAATVAFAGIAEEVVEGDADALDRALALRVHGLGSPALDLVMIAITYVGSAWVIVPAVALVAAYAWHRGHLRLAVILCAGVALAEILNATLKLLFARPRPGLFPVIRVPASASFPSGHSMASLVAYGAIAAVLIALHPRRAFPIVLAAGLLVLAIGLSRVYLGVHWPSDVVAGYAVGAITLAVIVHLTHRAEALS